MLLAPLFYREYLYGSLTPGGTRKYRPPDSVSFMDGTQSTFKVPSSGTPPYPRGPGGGHLRVPLCPGTGAIKVLEWPIPLYLGIPSTFKWDPSLP